MNAGERKGVHWGSVALGWLVTAVAGAAMRLLLGALYGSLTALPAEAGALNVTTVVLTLVSGFLAHLLGGFTAGRLSGHSGALNGA